MNTSIDSLKASLSKTLDDNRSELAGLEHHSRNHKPEADSLIGEVFSEFRGLTNAEFRAKAAEAREVAQEKIGAFPEPQPEDIAQVEKIMAVGVEVTRKMRQFIKDAGPEGTQTGIAVFYGMSNLELPAKAVITLIQHLHFAELIRFSGYNSLVSLELDTPIVTGEQPTIFDT